MSLLEGVNIIDDLDVAIDPETYPDQASPAPPAAGNYTFRIKSLSLRKDKDGNIVLKDGQYPVYVLEQVEILEPVEFARTVAPYQDISTKPFDREGRKATMAGDLARSLDQGRAISGLLELNDTLEEAVANNTTFRAFLDWTAYDSAFVKGEMEKVGLAGVPFANMGTQERETANKIYKAARRDKMKNFSVLPSGRHSHMWVGPSGETVEARAKLTRFYKSLEPVRLRAA